MASLHHILIAALALYAGPASAAVTAKPEVITVGGQHASIPVLDAFVSYSIEFAFFPDYAGNISNPNIFSNNLLNNIGNIIGTKPYIRVGGNTQDYAIYDPKLKVATNGTYVPSISTDYPLILSIGKPYFESYETFPDTKFIHGFNLAANTTQDRTLLLDTVPLVCQALRHGKLAYWELGNEPDLYKTSAQGDKRPANWTNQDYVNEWLNGTRAIQEKMRKSCPQQASNGTYEYYAPSFAGTGNALNIYQSWKEGIDVDNDIGIVSSHNYIAGATQLGVTLQGTLMNHTRIVQSIASHVSEATNLTASFLSTAKIPYILGETNSLYNEGRPGLSNSFGAALWGVDFNLWCAANNISRVHMHQGTSYRYQSWQPVNPRNENGTSIGTKAPYYGNIAVAATLGNTTAGDISITNLPLATDTESAYAVYANNVLQRITVISLLEYNTTASSTATSDANAAKKRPNMKYTFQVPSSCKGTAGIRRLMANGSDAITGITWDGYSYNYELENGMPVLLNNVTRGETAKVGKGGMVSLSVPLSSVAVLDLSC